MLFRSLEKSQKSRVTRLVRDELDAFFLWLQSVLRDALIRTTDNSSEPVNPDLTIETQDLREKFSPDKLEALTRRINQYRATLDSNAAQLLSLESFCLDFLSKQVGR